MMYFKMTHVCTCLADLALESTLQSEIRVADMPQNDILLPGLLV